MAILVGVSNGGESDTLFPKLCDNRMKPRCGYLRGKCQAKRQDLPAPCTPRGTPPSMLNISKLSTTKREGACTCQNWEVVLLQLSSRSLRSRAIVGIHGSLKGPQWSVVIVCSFGDYFTKLWRKTTPKTYCLMVSETDERILFKVELYSIFPALFRPPLRWQTPVERERLRLKKFENFALLWTGSIIEKNEKLWEMVLSVVTWCRLNKVWLVLHHEDIVLSYFVKYRSWNLIANRQVFLTPR